MCGIAGIVKFEGPLTAAEVSALLRMTEAQLHRGPDDWGILLPQSAFRNSDIQALLAPLNPQHIRHYADFSGGLSVALGSRRLSILDLSENGRMPMGSADGRNWIVHNGEVYNCRELRAELEGLGHVFRSSSDSEVVLRGFEAWGEQVVSRLRGMFAFLIFQSAPEPRLFLARDRFGIKPIYWSAGPGHALFASEVRALMSAGLVASGVEPEAVVRFLQLGSVPAPLTSYQHVHALPAGHCGRLQERELKVRSYWDLGEALRAQPIAGDVRGSIREALVDAVKTHLLSDVPLGIFLSGGVDSSALVALAHMAGQTPIKTVSLTFEEPEVDESRYARMVARRYQTEHGELCLRDSEFIADLPGILAAMDQPTVDGVNTYFVSKAARTFGLNVVFAGTGADELFLGYGHLQRAAELDRLRGGFAALPAGLRSVVVGGMSQLARGSGRWSRAPYLKSPSLQNLYLLFRGLFGPRDIRALLGLTQRELDGWGAPLVSNHADDCGAVDALVTMEFSHYLQDQLLRDTDFMSMAHSVEARVPFLDQQLVERVLRVPASERLRGATRKPLLVSAVSDLLPREVWDRPKRGFTLPMRRWVNRYRHLLRSMPRPRVVDADAADRVWQQFHSGREHWSRPWALFILEQMLGGTGAVPAKPLRPPPIHIHDDSPATAGVHPATAGRNGSPRRVAVLLSDFFDALGGIQTFNRCLVKALDEVAARHGWDVDLLVFNDKPGVHRSSPYFDARRVSYRAFGRDHTGFIGAAVATARQCSTVLVGHVNFTPVLAAMKMVAPGLESRMVAHGIEVWMRLPLAQRWSVPLLDGILSVSAFTRDEMRRRNHLNGLPFTLFPDTLDPFYSRGGCESDPRLDLRLPRGPMLLSVSRLHETEFYKRVDLLLQAMPRVLRDVPDAFLVVVGEGNGRKALEGVAARLGVSDRVIFTGQVADDLLPRYYQACDVFALPSLKEGFGIVFLEAMQFGKPCIGARAAAVPEVIVEGETGLLAEPGDAASLASACIRLLSDEPIRRRMGAAGRRRLEEQFSFEMFTNRLETVLCPSQTK